MKLAATGIVFLCLWFSLAWGRDEAMKFSRATVKGLVLESAPERYRQFYKDQYYQFVIADNSEPIVRTFLAHDLVQKRWLKITELSTEHARLGKAFNISREPALDFRVLENLDYARLPLKARVSSAIPEEVKSVLPDRIRFDPTIDLYRMYCNSQGNLPMSITTFWVLKSDLDAIQ